jgi:hypothetical protein
MTSVSAINPAPTPAEIPTSIAIVLTADNTCCHPIAPILETSCCQIIRIVTCAAASTAGAIHAHTSDASKISTEASAYAAATIIKICAFSTSAAAFLIELPNSSAYPFNSSSDGATLSVSHCSIASAYSPSIDRSRSLARARTSAANAATSGAKRTHACDIARMLPTLPSGHSMPNVTLKNF